MTNFISTIKKQVLLGDGAMGTMLVKHGLPRGSNPELWMLDNQEEIVKIHRSYLNAGSQIILTNTFGGNGLKLGEYGASSRVREINETAARLAKKAAGDEAFVAGSIGPTGHFPQPLGDFSWNKLVEVFAEQARALADGGVDFLFLETFSDLGEARAALFAAKNYTSLPVACSLTYTNGRTLTGSTPQIAATVLESLGADLIGANCSTGPKELLDVMKEYRKHTTLPLLVEPNAGMPELINGETIYRETPENMARYVEPFRQAGVNLIGACCGSTPEHIRAMSEALLASQPAVIESYASTTSTRLASRTKIAAFGPQHLHQIIGERINPTARKIIAQAFRDNDWNCIVEEGQAQIEAGASVLDLNVGVPGMDESYLLAQGVQQLQMALDFPLVLDCTRPEALERGLQEFQGKALINSVNGEKESLAGILPLAKKYGAAVLGLTLDDKGIPEKAEGRLKIAARIVDTALSYGLAKEDILIDCLVLTAAVSPSQAMETIRTISLVKKELGVNTVLGLSNVSHGLPRRSWLNATFLALALQAGLDAAIANPADERIKETMAASAVLNERDKGAVHFIAAAGKTPPETKNDIPANTKKEISLESLQEHIINGRQEPIIPLLKELIATTSIISIINEGIVPALEKIGDMFADGEVFLPQLILSGDAAKTAFTFIKKHLPETDFSDKGTIVIGTVKGDVHDIGKNITAALLENHGYRVIDLGKNIAAEKFVQTALEENAEIIGLSALMTTTMVEMKPVVELIKATNKNIKVIVGGAVVTEEFATQIGADGYGKDAVSAVKLVRSLLS